METKIKGYTDYRLSELSEPVAIKTVASQEYFYGEDSEMEKAFSDIERRASETIKKIITSDKLSNDVVSWFTLLVYTLIQSMRTPKRVDQFPTILKGAAESAKKVSPENVELIKKLKFPPSIIMALNYENLFRILSDTLDLKYKLVINRSPLPFITSDHPVFSYNQFMEKRVREYNGNGLLIKGTQVFLPISPKHLIIFYDKDVYKVGSVKSDVCSTSLNDDVKSINSLSALNARVEIFFSNSNEHRKYNFYSEFRKKHIGKTTGSEIPKVGLQLSFLKERIKAKSWTPVSPLSYYRNEVAGLKNLLLG